MTINLLLGTLVFSVLWLACEVHFIGTLAFPVLWLACEVHLFTYGE